MTVVWGKVRRGTVRCGKCKRTVKKADLKLQEQPAAITAKLDTKEKELEVKSRELELRARELELEKRSKSIGTEIKRDAAPLGKKEDIIVFVSYATADAELFKIRDISEHLTRHTEIKDVLYWQKDMKDDIIAYMNDNLGICDVILLFCSPNALASKPVQSEWSAAMQIDKPIIPVFVKPDHIPIMLKSKLGVEFDTFDFEKNIGAFKDLIMKKVS